MLEGSEVLGMGLGSCPLPGFVINRVRFWGFCERVYCVKKRLGICGRIAGKWGGGRQGGNCCPNFRHTVPRQWWLVGCLDSSLVRYIGTFECLDWCVTFLLCGIHHAGLLLVEYLSTPISWSPDAAAGPPISRFDGNTLTLTVYSH